MNDITGLTLTQTIKALADKEFSEEELNEAYFSKITKLNPKINSFLNFAKKSRGIPAAIKDCILTKGIKTTAGSNILNNFSAQARTAFIPQYNATVIEKLLEQGVSVLGKTNCDEFTMGSSGENSAFGTTKNPWDLTKVPGGSSSGSAVAVSADLCTFALGTDTGGSIRQPASLCGIVGLKPSYGRVSRYGTIAMASSFDQIGPMTKSVEDAALVLSWISGKDNFDSNCRKGKFILQPQGLQAGMKGLKVGVPKEYFEKGLDSEVEKTVKEAISKLEELGAEIVEVSLPHTEYGIAAYYVLITSEISSNYARYDGIRFGGTRDLFGSEVKRRIMLGTFALSTGYYDDYFAKAARVRTLIKQDFEKAFANCDVIVGPVSPTVAWNLGDKITDPLTMYLADVYTVPGSLAGIPGLSVPCGFSNGLPVGLQIFGKQWDEETILRVGYAYEQATVWQKEKPKL